MPTELRRDAGPGVGQAGHLEQALDGAVLAEGAVQDREGEVERDEATVGELAGRDASGRTTRCADLRSAASSPSATPPSKSRGTTQRPPA